MPLAHLAVVDLTQWRAGPYCTRLFAGFGADVVKVERPGGDPLRHEGPFAGGVPGPERGLAFHWLNLGKRSVVLDLKGEAGRAALLDMVRRADVLVENFAPRVLPALGLGWEQLQAVNPRLVMVSISNFGQTGPYRDFKADEAVLYAMSGGMIATGDPDKPPLAAGPAITQYTAGLHGFIGALAALYRRDETGCGERVDVSIQESALENVEIHLAEHAHDGKVARRSGDEHPLVPWRAYRCRDGWAAVVGGPLRNWRDGAKLFGEPRLTEEFAQVADRIARRREVEALMRPWLMSHDKRDIYALGQAAGLAFGWLATPGEVLESEQHAARGFFQQTEPHPELGRLTVCGAPFRSEQWGWRTGRAPLLDEHRDEVLAGEAA